MDWLEQAKCDGQDTETFYPPRDHTYSAHAERARAICHGDGTLRDPRCPVIRDCLLYALVMPDQHGVWGGMSSRERKTLHRRKDLPDYVTREDLEGLGLLDGETDGPELEEVPGYEKEANLDDWPNRAAPPEPAA